MARTALKPPPPLLLVAFFAITAMSAALADDPPTPATSPPTAAPTTSDSTTKPTSSETSTVTMITTNVPTPTPGPTTTANIVFVNDLHYHLYPVDATSDQPCSVKDVDADSCVGGLACLYNERPAKEDKQTLWLHGGLGIGYGEPSGLDLFKALTAAPAIEALKLLGFQAASADADLLRSGAPQVAEAVKALDPVCANCKNVDSLKDVKTYKTLMLGACGFTVIGVISKAREASAADELESVKAVVEEVKKANPNMVFVVVGEVSEELAQSILSSTDVSFVFYSGSKISEKDGIHKKVMTDKNKAYATLAPTTGKASMLVGKVQLTLDATCKVTGLTDASFTAPANYANPKCTVPDSDKASVTDIVGKMLKAFEDAAQPLGKAVLNITADNCGIMSCTLGQLAADGVRAVTNEKVTSWAEATRTVVIPASQFKAGLLAGSGGTAADISELDILNATGDEDTLCLATVTGSQLWDLVNGLLSGKGTFPQVSGMLVDYVMDDGPRAGRVWLEQPDLSMTLVKKDDGVTTFKVSVTCSDLAPYTVKAKEQTSLKVSDGLLWHLRKAGANLVPPSGEQRVRFYVPPPMRADLCEDWVGMTVAYTLLCLGAMLMVGYQGYQLWRFRSALSYVR